MHIRAHVHMHIVLDQIMYAFSEAMYQEQMVHSCLLQWELAQQQIVLR